MKIKKAVIPAAGFGTRILPATKTLPKEMYPIIDKPAVQYVVEEAVQSGITDILIVISRGKGIIEDHFDRTPELELILKENSKDSLLESIRSISDSARVHFIRQKIAKGLGDAILCAQGFANEEAFAVLYPDDVMYSDKKPVCRQLIDAYKEFGLGVLGAKKISLDQISRYGSLKVKNIRDNLYMCTDMIEKPSRENVMSPYSILGRCILPPEIFEILKNTPRGVGNEIQLTDAMKVLAQTSGMIAVDFEGERYDMGSKLGILKAFVEMGIRHRELSRDFKSYLRELTEREKI